MNETGSTLRGLLGLSLLMAACSNGATVGASGTADCVPPTNFTNNVAVRLVNQTTADLFVWYSYTDALYTFDDPNPPVTTDFGGICGNTCANFSCHPECTHNLNPTVVRITPQGTYQRYWNGAVLEQRTVPVACLPQGMGCSSTSTSEMCTVWVEPKAYPISFSSQAWTGVDCGAGQCTCTPDSTGSCEIPQLVYTLNKTGSNVQGAGIYAKGATSFDILFQ
jgi:hypothetical protein